MVTRPAEREAPALWLEVGEDAMSGVRRSCYFYGDVIEDAWNATLIYGTLPCSLGTGSRWSRRGGHD